jgi:hypothetical protein
MTLSLEAIFNSVYAALILFVVTASIAGALRATPLVRVLAGIAAIIGALFLMVSTRPLLTWMVSTIERPSVPGFVLLVALAVAAVSGWRLDRTKELRFAAVVLAIAGAVLYPSATGFLNADSYTIGFSGYVLPVALCAIIGYAIYRGYLVSALTLNASIVVFLLGLGDSRNLWDYVIDPIAWFIGIGFAIALALGLVSKRFSVPQPSSGIGDTPISH